jgi:uncharacterized membrane protein
MSSTVGERRLPPYLALVVAMTLPFLRPEKLSPGPWWILSLLEGGLLVAMIIADPGRIDRRTRRMRRLRVAVVLVLVVSATLATALLVDDIVSSGPATNAAPVLLRAGVVVWMDVVIAFAFLYWEFDSGGPAERAHAMTDHPDLAFPQQLNPEVKRLGWRPVFVDYLYLGVTNGFAFSPTDVMPLSHGAKGAMAAQSIASLSIIGLVLARAVNVLS